MLRVVPSFQPREAGLASFRLVLHLLIELRLQRVDK
jgi:hypothetical protein